MGLEGSIEEFGLADILQLLYFQKKTGVLTVESRLGRIKIYFHTGDIVGVESKGRVEDKRIGRILVKKGMLTEDQLKEVLDKQKASGDKMGNVLIKSKLITLDEIRDVIVGQLTDAVVQLFNWKKGTYEFRPQKVVLDKDFEISVDTQHLLMEGLRVVDEWSAIEERITLDTVYRETGKGQAEATAEEKSVLALVDGETDVSTIIEVTGEDDLQVSRILIGLLDRGVIEEVGQKTFVVEKEPRRKRRRVGVPFIAILTSLMILLSLAVSLGPVFLMKQNIYLIGAEKGIQEVRLAIEIRKHEQGAYPETIRGIARRTRDPWGHEFIYRLTDTGYVLKSAGADGVDGTSDDVY